MCQWPRKTYGTSVLGTAKSPFSAPYISINTKLISIKLTYFMPSTYTPNLKEIGYIYVSENYLIFFTFFFFAKIIEPTKTNFSYQ